MATNMLEASKRANHMALDNSLGQTGMYILENLRKEPGMATVCLQKLMVTSTWATGKTQRSLAMGNRCGQTGVTMTASGLTECDTVKVNL